MFDHVVGLALKWLKSSKQTIDTNANESVTKSNHQRLYASGTTVIVGYSIMNDIIKDRLRSRKDNC